MQLRPFIKGLISVLRHRRIRILAEIIITLFLIGFIVFLAQIKQYELSKPKRVLLEKYAQKIIDRCKNNGNQCFDKEIPKLMNKISMKEAFEIVQIITQKISTYSNCHEVAHELSEIAIEKNPSSWKSIIRSCPTACNGGCVHGALVAHFKGLVNITDSRMEKIKPEIKSVCRIDENWHPTSNSEIQGCHHALGHAFIYLTHADLNKSLDLCKYQVMKPKSTDFKFCLGGVFMSIYNATSPEDIELTKNIHQTKATIPSFCSKFSGQIYNMCHLESFILFINELQSSKEIEKFCSYTLTDEDKKWCLHDIVGEVAIRLILHQNSTIKIRNLCNELNFENVENCFSDAATILVQINNYNLNRSLEICKLAPNHGSTCIPKLIIYAKKQVVISSDEFMLFCNNLPAKWSNQCIH